MLHYWASSRIRASFSSSKNKWQLNSFVALPGSQGKLHKTSQTMFWLYVPLLVQFLDNIWEVEMVAFWRDVLFWLQFLRSHKIFKFMRLTIVLVFWKWLPSKLWLANRGLVSFSNTWGQNGTLENYDHVIVTERIEYPTLCERRSIGAYVSQSYYW